MQKDNSFHDSKGKPLFAFVGLVVAGVVLLATWPPNKSAGQDPQPIRVKHAGADSAAIFERQARELRAATRQQDSVNLVRATELAAQTKKLQATNRPRRADVPCDVNTLVIPTDSSTIEVPVLMYKNYVIADVDDILRALPAVQSHDTAQAAVQAVQPARTGFFKRIGIIAQSISPFKKQHNHAKR